MRSRPTDGWPASLLLWGGVALLFAIPGAGLAKPAFKCDDERPFAELAKIDGKAAEECAIVAFQQAADYWNATYGAATVVLLPMRHQRKTSDFFSPLAVQRAALAPGTPDALRQAYEQALRDAARLDQAGFFRLDRELQDRLNRSPATARRWHAAPPSTSWEDDEGEVIGAILQPGTQKTGVGAFLDKYTQLEGQPMSTDEAVQHLMNRRIMFKAPQFTPEELDYCQKVYREWRGEKAVMTPQLLHDWPAKDYPTLRGACNDAGGHAGYMQLSIADSFDDMLESGQIDELLQSVLFRSSTGAPRRAGGSAFELTELRRVLDQVLRQVPDKHKPTVARMTFTLKYPQGESQGQHFFALQTKLVNDHATIEASESLVRASFSYCYAGVRHLPYLDEVVREKPFLLRSRWDEETKEWAAYRQYAQEQKFKKENEGKPPFATLARPPKSRDPLIAYRVELPARVDDLRKCTWNMFAFALSHEVGHAVLRMEEQDDTEADCDCFASSVVGAKSNESLGLFYTLLTGAISRGLPELWVGQNKGLAEALTKRVPKAVCASGAPERASAGQGPA